MPDEQSYLDKAVEDAFEAFGAAERFGSNGFHIRLRAAIEVAEPYIREQIQAELREALTQCLDEARAACDSAKEAGDESARLYRCGQAFEAELALQILALPQLGGTNGD